MLFSAKTTDKTHCTFIFGPKVHTGMSRALLVLLSVFVFVNLSAQQIDVEEAVRRLTGVSDVEALDAEQVEMYSDLYRHPVDLNRSTRSFLESAGLFTPFQLASLIDYRERHGSILSMVELASVDGFTDETVNNLKPFIILSPDVLITRKTAKFSGDFSTRCGYKADRSKDVSKAMYGLKSRICLDFSPDKVTVTFAASGPYDSSRIFPTVCSTSLLYQHRAGKLVVGDFNARYGQGLCLWNTTAFSSLNAPSAFMKRPSGISAVNSFTGSSALTGVAADLTLGRWQIAAMLSVPGIKNLQKRPDDIRLSPVLNIMRYGRFGHFACTHMMSFSSFLTKDFLIPQMRTSIDGSCCIKGVNVFGEGMYDWVDRKFSFLTGTQFGLIENIRAASMVRYLPSSNEHGAAVALEATLMEHRLQASIDALYHPISKSKDGSMSRQIRIQANWIWEINAALQTKIRAAERLRTWGTGSRTELRVESVYEYRNWKFSFRADALNGLSYAGLTYLEAGYLTGKVSAYIRYGIFHIDNWDDRIYVYERDAPANFNVPSFYGRGFWASCYVAYKPSRWSKLYMRGIYKKPGNAELKLYCILEF